MIDHDQGFTLLSGEESRAKALLSLEIPSLSERESVPMGAYVKLAFSVGERVERIWVQVTGREPGGGYHSELANDPVLVPLKDRDRVDFMPAHIIDILGEDE